MINFFKKNNYIVVKNAISKEIAELCFEYIYNKSLVAKTLFNSNYISQFEKDWGHFGDDQVPNTYSHYADILMETLLQKVKPILEKNINNKVIETYAYCRVYKKGDILARHKDRFSCEISATLALGSDEKWPIYLDPTGKIGNKGIEVILEPGDMLVYRGCELEHWRTAFKGNICGQVFLHYNDASNKNANHNKFDGRPHLGLPEFFKKK
jgi:hypothetical protein